ncbi:MAG: Gfo/Idh/MocA family oxidoreductase [Firmicutes bacterium]|nr:Gfo/Idh/MocA family oxidoreductase [Bacillota bacterium]
MTKILKAAIVGCGSISSVHANAIQNIANLVAICDSDTAKTAKFSQTYKNVENFQNCRIYKNFEEMLNIGGIDVLHVCLPHFLHEPVSVYAMQRGVNVLCEKPMSISLQEGENMVNAAKNNGVTLGVIFQNRYNPGVQLAKKALDNGKLGKIKSGYLKVTWFRDENYYKSDWRGKWQTEGGGVLINQSIHTFDLMNYFLANKLDYVSASISNRAHPYIEVEDVAEGVICYGDVKISFYVNTFHPYDSPVALKLICENGTISIIGDSTTISYLDGTQETVAPETDTTLPAGAKSYWGVSHKKQISDFYEAIVQQKTPQIDGAEALKTQRLICGIYESAKTGKPFEF